MNTAKRTAVTPERLLAVAKILEARARIAAFAPSYTRMNRTAGLRNNVFYFGSPRRPPRAVIFGPYLYIHAPGVPLPRAVDRVGEEERLARHLGALHARIRLAGEQAIALVLEVCDRMGRAVQQSPTGATKGSRGVARTRVRA